MIRWPPMFPKIEPWRSLKWLKGAEGEACVRCGVMDGTVVGAHFSGRYAEQFGRGKGVKAGDNLIADLCQACHTEMDSYGDQNDDARALEFAICIFRTQARRLNGSSW